MSYKRIMLCGRRGGCCPEICIDGDEVRIDDDYLNTIIITMEQFNILKEKIKNGEFD